MKRYWLVLMVVMLVISGCQVDKNQTIKTELKVIAAESFLADITQQVAGERLTIESLIPIGTDPHAYEPTPRDMARVAESDLLIISGAGLEEWLKGILTNIGGSEKIFEASSGLTSREAREGEEAVMSAEEKVEALCVDLKEQTIGQEIIAGNNAAVAARLNHEKEHGGNGDPSEHEPETKILSIKLNGTDKEYSGFLLFDVAEDGEYIITANGGSLTVTGSDGTETEVEETLAVNCAGLNGGILLDLEPGEYLITLKGFSTEITPFFAGKVGGHHHHEGDPHFWLDPINVIRYVENIRDRLTATDPNGKETYEKNAAVYIAKLNDLDAWIKQQLSAIPKERRLILTNHESFGYFADRYGFKIIGTIIPSVSTGASPSAQQMARLVDRVRQSGVKAIFLETGSNPKLAEQIAQETGIKVVSDLYTHSVTEPAGKAATYIDMMKYNVQEIVKALK